MASKDEINLVAKLKKIRDGSKPLRYVVKELSENELNIINNAGENYTLAIQDNEYDLIYLACIYFSEINKDNDKELECLNSLLKKFPNDAVSYNNRGIIWNSKIEYKKAIDDYSKALEIKQDYVFAYNNRGNSWKNIREYDKAIDDYNNAIRLNPKYANAYNNLGTVWIDKGEYNKAIEVFNKAIERETDLPVVYINRANAYFENGQHKKSLIDYKKYISLPEDRTDAYLIQYSKDRIDGLNKSIKTPSFKVIADTVDKIKKLLLYADHCITHYTGMSVAKFIILEDSLFRLSEGAFLNDTSEGRELFNFLDIQFTSKITENTEAELFAKKPFIGSFVSENKHDNLTLWRMYGKEGKEEAKGCAITIDRNKFIDSIKNKLMPDKTKESKINDDFQFYRVAYKNHEGKGQFVIPGTDRNVGTKLNKLMTDLSIHVREYNKTKKQDLTAKKNLEEKLNEIAYLFKSVEYQHENELRLVLKGIGFDKKVDRTFDPPRVYIELVNMRSLIKKITLGPKVERADEWASAFFYNLEKDNYEPQLFISHLPFK